MPLRFAVLFFWSLSFWVLNAQQPGPGDYEFKVVADRPDALYQVKESVIFKIALTRNGEPVTTGKITCVLSNDDAVELKNEEIALSEKPMVIVGKLDFPGFLRCKATFKDEAGKTLVALAGAGIEPSKINASAPVPNDFDSFWAAKKKALAQIPMEPAVTPVESKRPTVESFDVQLKCWGDVPVSGYLVKPKGAKPKSLPAIIFFHAANVESASLIAATEGAEAGMLAFDINPHGSPNGKPLEFYQELAKGKLAGYPAQGRESRDTSYFLGMFLRGVRAVDYLTSLPEWDGKTVILRGSSMGGGQAFAVAGLDSRVTAFAANVPALCDHTGAIAGWPRLVQFGADGKPTNPNVFETARYFDAMNFATRTKADALVCVGFIDHVCRPTSVYAAYNNLPSNKRIINEPLMKHETFQSTTESFRQFFADHIEKMKKSVP
ncbi:MAG: acetylxylan esterase [Verrucomicrobia bacterium]|nr:acetylxylan esterase [Verrucomicrobiota bacterium]